jgi:hypothetical protein
VQQSATDKEHYKCFTWKNFGFEAITSTVLKTWTSQMRLSLNHTCHHLLTTIALSDHPKKFQIQWMNTKVELSTGLFPLSIIFLSNTY